MDNDNQAFPPIPDKQEIKTAKNLSFAKTLSYGFVIVSVGVSIAIGGYLLGVSKTKPQPVAPKVSVSPSPTPDPTANWQTYKNNIYSFKLPVDWETFNLNGGALMIAPKKILTEKLKSSILAGMGGGSFLTIVISELGQSQIDKGYVADSDKTVTQRQTTISGLPATEYMITWITDLPGVKKGDISISNVVEDRGVKYSISLANNDELEAYRQILSTFKFTNSGAQNGNFIISISFRNRDEKKYIEIKNISLPIDSETEACDLLSQVNTAVYRGNKFGCSVSDKGSYWEFNNKIICEPSFPFPCRGGLSGKLNKSNGNIDGFEAVIVS